MDNKHVASTVENFVLPKIRRLIQFLMLGVLGKWAYYGIFRCPFLVPFVNCQSCPVITCWGRITTLFWGFWLFIPLSALFVGRAFCGWFCPGGMINQLIGKISLYTMRVRTNFTRFASWGKYIGLIVVLVLWFILDNPRSLPPIRIGEFWSSMYLTIENASLGWIVRTLVVLGFVTGGLLIANAWCRFACPMGGFLGLIQHFSIFKVYKTKACNNCNACRRICEMGTRPAEENCTNCGDCLKSCPQQAIQFGRKGKKE